jgi:hypothetical protein
MNINVREERKKRTIMYNAKKQKDHTINMEKFDKDLNFRPPRKQKK